VTAIDKRLPEPFEHIEVSVTSARTLSGKPLHPVVEITNTKRGEGQMRHLAYAEAEARAVLDAIAQFRAQQETT
jgi:hypothetical protein